MHIIREKKNFQKSVDLHSVLVEIGEDFSWLYIDCDTSSFRFTTYMGFLRDIAQPGELWRSRKKLDHDEI